MAKRASAATPNSAGDALKKEGAKWLERIEAAWKREEGWAKDAELAVKAYTNESAGNGKLYDYNILHSNTETIVPAIINSPPVPDIRRRFGDDDPVAKQLSDIIERAISVQVDDSRLEVELEGQAQDGFLAGRGVIRLRFHADTQETETSALEEAEDAAEGVGESGRGYNEGVERRSADLVDVGEADDQDGDDLGPAQAVANERITFEAVSWRDYQHGPAKRWEDRPWESFRHVMQPEDVTSFADGDLVNTQSEPGGKLFGDTDGDCTVYEIWDRAKQQVIFISDNGKVLKKLPDPLGLSTFFPTSRPVQPIEVVGRLMPVTPFSIYMKLADELDIITKRIRVLTAAMKLKGGVIGALSGDLTALGGADDNELVTLNGLEALAQLPGGLDGAVMWWPVEKFFPVLAELFKNRDLTKQAIYEITGISDIVRGASKASETLGAQQIKSQWGALRIQKMQRMMERSARDLFVMMAEIIPAKFSYATLERMTAIPIIVQPTDDEATAQGKLKLQELMKQKISTQYRVDVESQSTVRADLTQKKQEMSEFLDGSAKFFAGMQPIVAEGGPGAAEGALEIYAAATRNFDLGKSAEDAIEKMVVDARAAAKEARDNPQPPPPSPEQIKAQADAKEAEARAAAEQQRAQTEAQTAEVENAERTQALQAKQMQDQQALAASAAETQAKSRAAEQKAADDARLGAINIEIRNTELAIARAKLAAAGMELLTPAPVPANADGTPAPKPEPVDKDQLNALIANLLPPPDATADVRHNETAAMIGQLGQQQVQIAQALAQIAGTLSAPKRVIRDEQGRAMGVEPVAVN